MSEWKGVAQWILTGFVAWVWWSIKTRFTTKEDHSELEKRVAAVEQAVKNLPTIKDHHEVMVKLTELVGNMKRIDENVKRQQLQLDRVEEYIKESGN